MATMERRHVLDLSRGWILLGMMTLLLSTMIPTRRMQQPASSSSVASAFSLSPSPFARTRIRKRSILAAAATTGSSPTSSSHDDGEQDDSSSLPTIPLTYNEMISQATQCISDAYTHAGISRQIVRVLLPRRVEYQTRPGERIEEDANTNDRTKVNEMKLIPPDESWQGGILQLYRAACPMAVELLREMSGTFRDAGVPPRIVEDRSIDESGVDGLGLCYTQLGGERDDDDAEEGTGSGFFFGGDDVALPKLSERDNCIFVQPNQEAVEIIEKLSTQSSSSSLMALLNPQWRDVDDAFDAASKNDGVFGALASFLGGKGSATRRLEGLGYVPTYTLEGYVCRGGNVRMVKRYDSEWVVYAERDKERGDYTSYYVELGRSVERPRYQDVEAMLDEKGISYKYARDLGMAPKL